MSTTAVAKQLTCDFLMGPILETVSDIPLIDPNHSKLSSSRECETSSLPSPSRIPVLSLECFLFPCCCRHGSPIFSKYIFLLMKRKRTTRRTMKTPTADKKPMASGGTGKRTQKKKNHIITTKVNQLLVLSTDQSLCLLIRVANALPVFTLAGIPRTVSRRKLKNCHPVHPARPALQMTDL